MHYTAPRSSIFHAPRLVYSRAPIFGFALDPPNPLYGWWQVYEAKPSPLKAKQYIKSNQESQLRGSLTTLKRVVAHLHVTYH